MSRSRPITRGSLRVVLPAASVALAIVALLAVSTAPGIAAEGGQSKQPDQKAPAAQQPAAKQPKAKQPAAKAAPQGGDSGQRAFIDPATGKLREPAPGESEAVKPAARRALRVEAPQEISGPGGAVGVAVPEDAMSYSVATIAPDGTVSTACVTGKAKAEAVVKSPATAKKTTKEEHNHDR
jgi:hypothetical protein